jgi:uncharacterized protein (DUF2141 family)
MSHIILCVMRVAAGLALVACLWSPAAAQTLVGCNAADASQVQLEVSVSGMHSDKGNVTITIYPDDAAHFLDGAYKVGRQILPVTLPVTHVCFVLPAPGYYAVALFHDENNNHHFDTTFLGLPAEGYGFSNNPSLFTGLPSLGQTRIPVHVGTNPVAVQMKYF